MLKNTSLVLFTLRVLPSDAYAQPRNKAIQLYKFGMMKTISMIVKMSILITVVENSEIYYPTIFGKVVYGRDHYKIYMYMTMVLDF